MNLSKMIKIIALYTMALIVIGITLILIIAFTMMNMEPVNEVPINVEPSSEWVTDEPVINIYGTYDFECNDKYTIAKYFNAPNGYKYVVVSYTVYNDGSRDISTNPHYWSFVVDDVSYSHDVTSYTDEINHQSVNIKPGGTFSSTIVFSVPKSSTGGILEYSNIFNETLKRDNTLIN